MERSWPSLMNVGPSLSRPSLSCTAIADLFSLFSAASLTFAARCARGAKKAIDMHHDGVSQLVPSLCAKKYRKQSFPPTWRGAEQRKVRPSTGKQRLAVRASQRDSTAVQQRTARTACVLVENGYLPQLDLFEEDLRAKHPHLHRPADGGPVASLVPRGLHVAAGRVGSGRVEIYRQKKR